MTGQYAYTWYIWPTLGAAGLMAILAGAGWRRRPAPAALPFALLMVFGFLWAAGAALELAAAHAGAKVFWVKFQAAWQLPAATAGVWFALEYANPSGWKTRVPLALLAIPPLVTFFLIVSNEVHHVLWLGFAIHGEIRPVLGIGGWILSGYGVMLALTTSLLFVWLLLRSPRHRWPAAICLCGQIGPRVAFVLDTTNANPVAPMDPTIFASVFTACMYALALFRFRMFHLIPIARGAMIDQMREGMLVLDNQRRIVDLNPAAASILGISRALPTTRNVLHNLREFPELSASLNGPLSQCEVTLGAGETARHYAVNVSALKDPRGFFLGQLILLHDLTEQDRAHAQLLEQRRVLATLEERERVARELHDSLGQVLAYVRMQAHGARELLARGQAAEADACLVQLRAAAQEAHADVREYILGAGMGGSSDPGLLPTLKEYLRQFSQSHGIAATLHVPPGLTDRAFGPMVATQLLRIIEESLTNVRKHARARAVDVRLTVADGAAEAVVRDDGVGFDPMRLQAAGQTFGLRVMSERAREVGGSFKIYSAPGEGTQVIVCVPLQEEPA